MFQWADKVCCTVLKFTKMSDWIVENPYFNVILNVLIKNTTHMYLRVLLCRIHPSVCARHNLCFLHLLPCEAAPCKDCCTRAQQGRRKQPKEWKGVTSRGSGVSRAMFLGHGHTPAFPRRWWSRSVAITFLEAGRVKNWQQDIIWNRGRSSCQILTAVTVTLELDMQKLSVRNVKWISPWELK